ncbi:unnamed protein product [Bathycoccus prasinos]
MKTTTDNDDEDNDDAHSDENNIVRVLFCGEEFIGGFEATKRYVEASSSSSSSSDGVTVKVQNCSRERVKDMIQEYDVLVPLMTRFDEEVISSAAGGFSDHGKKLSKCKLILQFGVGLEGVAIDLATKAGIKVGRIRSDSNPNATSTAEMGVFLTLAALKRINECQISVEIKVLGSPMGESLFGATVLFVGWGRVAKATRNNIVVIACTCTPENRKMVNKTFLDSLKFGEDRVPGIVVNVARGALVDERAMREACENGTVLYYATDVCYDEPVDVGGDLLSLGENGKRASNIFVTPHVGGVTVNSYERMGKIVAEYARKIVKEKRIESDECVSIVN